MEIMKKTMGFVFHIQRFSLQDGPGIRTTIFLKGCPLNCLWCHNPESKEKQVEIGYNSQKCINCGFCIETCPAFCHNTESGKHVFHREYCTRCGLCTQKCCSGALEVIGSEMTAESIIQEVVKDKAFYRNSGGGMTLSGGEPLYQYEFSYVLLRLAKDAGLHTCVETSGAGVFNNLLKFMEYTDLFLFDVKETNPLLHEKYTGITNKGIMKNLMDLDRSGGRIILRCPVIPGLNDREDHFRNIGELAEGMKNIQQIDVEPYHPLGVSKSVHIGKEPLYDVLVFPDNTEVEGWMKTIRKYTQVTVKRS